MTLLLLNQTYNNKHILTIMLMNQMKVTIIRKRKKTKLREHSKRGGKIFLLRLNFKTRNTEEIHLDRDI